MRPTLRPGAGCRKVGESGVSNEPEPIDPRLSNVPVPGVTRERAPALGVIAGFLLIGLLALWSRSPPAPAGTDAPPDAFSAARAGAVLERLLGDGHPHPTGSAANAEVRARIVAELRGLGYEPEVQPGFACSPIWPVCAGVQNVVAQLPGAGGGEGVLLAAHYDSVAAGPGAGDDGAGIGALLEIARALKASGPLPRSVWFLLGDGEEAGLLDAEAFVRRPEFGRLGSVVNVEARGTGGPSQLFETQTGNAAIVSLAGTALDHPVGSSLAYEIYKLLPNDTDFTVFRREGLAGVNFGFTEGPARYHTPLDNLRYLDRGSLQHHGENALAMARALAGAEAVPRAAGDKVFFDLFGAVLVTWPVGWNAVLLAIGGLAWVLLAWRVRRNRALRIGRLLATSAVLLVAPAAALGLGLGLQRLLAGTAPAASDWTAQGTMLVLAFMALGVGVATAIARPLARWCGATELGLAALLVFGLLAAATLVFLPGASFLALLPLLAGALAAHLRPSQPVFWGAGAAFFTAVLWVPFASLVYQALGYGGLAGVPLLILLALLPLLPAIARAGRAVPLTAVAGLALVAVVGIALARPAFTEAVPRRMNLLYVSDGDAGRVYFDSLPGEQLPAPLLDGNHEAPLASFPWSERLRVPGDAGPALPPPEVAVLEDRATPGGRRLALSLRSVRNARVLYLVFPDSAKAAGAAVEGVPVTVDSGGEWTVLAIIAPPDGEARIALDIEATGPLTLYGADVADGLPDGFDALKRARDAVAVPVGVGDRSAAWREVVLEASPASPEGGQ
jgi:hypothetical protein